MLNEDVTKAVSSRSELDISFGAKMAFTSVSYLLLVKNGIRTGENYQEQGKR